MALGVTWSAIHLGNIADIDTDESDIDAENQNDLVGTYGSGADRLARHVTTITSNSSDNDTVDFDHAPAPEDISYDIGAGPVTAQIDSAAQVDATVTFTDQTTASLPVGVIQATNGDLFLLISDSQAVLASKPIESLEITSVVSSAFTAAGQLTRDDLEFVCFAPGTAIATPAGPRPVETLRPGDPVLTDDHGARPLIWTGRRRLVFGPAPHKQKPVLIPRGALAPGVPARDLVLSPQHRVLIGGAALGRAHGVAEALAPAKALIGRRGIRQMRGKRTITYVTLLCRRHQILRAEGARVESFLPRRYALSLLRPAERRAVVRLLPRLLADPDTGYGPPARPLLTVGAARALGAWTHPVAPGAAPEAVAVPATLPAILPATVPA